MPSNLKKFLFLGLFSILAAGLLAKEEPDVRPTRQSEIQINSLSCEGAPVNMIWDHAALALDFNRASAGQIEQAMRQIAERMPQKYRRAYTHHLNAQGKQVDLIAPLGAYLISERQSRCGEFKDIRQVTFQITEFSDRQGVKRVALMYLLGGVRGGHEIYQNQMRIQAKTQPVK